MPRFYERRSESEEPKMTGEVVNKRTTESDVDAQWYARHIDELIESFVRYVNTLSTRSDQIEAFDDFQKKSMLLLPKQLAAIATDIEWIEGED